MVPWTCLGWSDQSRNSQKWLFWILHLHRCSGVWLFTCGSSIPPPLMLCCLQVSDRVTSLAPSACLSSGSLTKRACSCLWSSWSSSSRRRRWTWRSPCAGPAVPAWLPVTWCWPPICAGPLGRLCTMGPGTSGSQSLHQSTSSPRSKVPFEEEPAMVTLDPD